MFCNFITVIAMNLFHQPSVSDPLCQHRYHCTHEAGVHSVGLAWFKKLHNFLESGEYILYLRH